MKFKDFLLKPYVLLTLSAIFSAMPFTFSWAFPLSWVSFVPLFYVILNHNDGKLRTAFGRGFLFGFIYYFCIYYWFLWLYPLDYVNLAKGPSVAVVALAWLGISTIHGALWCLPTVCCRLAKKASKNIWFLSALAIVCIIAAEKLTGLGELSFPWVRVALGQYKATALIQGASLFGIDGVDILILSINALIAICIVSPHKRRIIAAASAVAIFCVNLGFGLIRIRTENSSREITIMTVQASVDQSTKWSGSGNKICYDMYSNLTTDNFTDNIDLVIWPESAVPKVYSSEKALKQYKSLAKELDAPILAGILLKNEEYHTNNAILIDKDSVKANYAKRQLVPFGEYMPYQKALSKLFPYLTNLNIIEDDYISGESSAIMKTDIGNLGNIICFESIYPHLTRQSVRDGAELMIETTNDSWLEDSPAMYQHLAHGVFRSVENGRYLVRSANSGVSATIDSRGNIIKTLDINQRGTITDTVYMISEQTLYTKLGDFLFPLLGLTVIIWYLVYVVQYFYKKRTKKDIA